MLNAYARQIEEELTEHEPGSSGDDKFLEFLPSPAVRVSSRSRQVRNVTYVDEAEV